MRIAFSNEVCLSGATVISSPKTIGGGGGWGPFKCEARMGSNLSRTLSSGSRSQDLEMGLEL